MSKSTRDNTKRKRPEQAGQLIGVRFQPDDLDAVDSWRTAQADTPSRPEAVRRLIRDALTRKES